MATVINDSDYRSKIAGGTIAAYTFVELQSDDTVDACTAITEIVYGVVQNAVVEGELATIKVSGESKVVAQEALALNVFVGPHTGGKAVTAASTSYPRGRVVEASGAADDICVVELINVAVALA